MVINFGIGNMVTHITYGSDGVYKYPLSLRVDVLVGCSSPLVFSLYFILFFEIFLLWIFTWIWNRTLNKNLNDINEKYGFID